eukprot:5870097-Amphidinium_carterae.1
MEEQGYNMYSPTQVTRVKSFNRSTVYAESRSSFLNIGKKEVSKHDPRDPDNMLCLDWSVQNRCAIPTQEFSFRH